MTETVATFLLRPKPSGFEILLMQRPGGAFAPPSGRVHAGEDPRTAAARTPFEACGVLLARDVDQLETLEMPSLPALRKKIRAGADATEVVRSVGLAWSTDAVLPWSHWLDGEDELRIYIAETPPGMLPTFSREEQVEHAWMRPVDAQAHGDFEPPFVRTCWELAREATIAEVFAAARTRAEEALAIAPRRDNTAWLLPWDPEYGAPLEFQPKWAIGPSRFVLEDRTWKHIAAPGSTRAG